MPKKRPPFIGKKGDNGNGHKNKKISLSGTHFLTVKLSSEKIPSMLDFAFFSLVPKASVEKAKEIARNIGLHENSTYKDVVAAKAVYPEEVKLLYDLVDIERLNEVTKNSKEFAKRIIRALSQYAIKYNFNNEEFEELVTKPLDELKLKSMISQDDLTVIKTLKTHFDYFLLHFDILESKKIFEPNTIKKLLQSFIISSPTAAIAQVIPTNKKPITAEELKKSIAATIERNKGDPEKAYKSIFITFSAQLKNALSVSDKTIKHLEELIKANKREEFTNAIEKIFELHEKQIKKLSEEDKKRLREIFQLLADNLYNLFKAQKKVH